MVVREDGWDERRGRDQPRQDGGRYRPGVSPLPRGPLPLACLLTLVLLSTTVMGASLDCVEEVRPGKEVLIEAQFPMSGENGSLNATFEMVGPEGNTLVVLTEDLDGNGSCSLVLRFPKDASIGVYTVHATHWTGLASERLNRSISIVNAPAPPPPFPIVPLILGTLVLVGVVGMAGIEYTRYSLVVLLLPLFSRLQKGDVLDNKTRYAIHGIIIENPGIHYNAIQKEFGLTNGAAAYHLRVLEREDFIRSVRDGRLRRFYSRTTKVPDDKRLTPEEIKERILELVTATPGISQRQIVLELGIERDTVGYHLRDLCASDKLQSSRNGKYMVYHSKRLT